ncbi:hypothetical protein P3S68_008494 [Capsicum galapagoense]
MFCTNSSSSDPPLVSASPQNLDIFVALRRGILAIFSKKESYYSSNTTYQCDPTIEVWERWERYGVRE